MSTAEEFNSIFASHVSTSEGREKIAEKTQGFLLDRLRETTFADKIVPPVPVTRAECQVSEYHDTLIKMEFIEPRSRAMTLSFRTQPSVNFIRGERYAIGFYTISTEMFQKTEEELMIYPFNITKVIEENSLKDIGEVKDREFLVNVESCVQALQTEANAGISTALTGATAFAASTVQYSVRKGELARNSNGTATTVFPIQVTDVVEGSKMLINRRLRPAMILINDNDCEDFNQWTLEDLGDKLQSETAVSGWTANTVKGKKFVRTIKVDICRTGNVYFFTDSNFFGRSYILNNVKFYIDKVMRTISFSAWMTVGMGFGNVAACAKMELYAADANPATQLDTTILAGLRPVEEESIGALNNRLASGVKFPSISQY